MPGVRKNGQAAMIRKAIIVVLTLGAITTAIGSIICPPNRCWAWEINERRSVWVIPSIHLLTLMYLRVDDPAKPAIRRSFAGFQFVRDHMYSRPSDVYSKTAYAVC